jgi:hypothetical protein
MAIHIALLDDAASSFRSALSDYKTLVAAAPEKREPRMIGQCIAKLHLGLEKGLKHALSEIDEALPISGLSGSVLQELRRTQREQKTPSLLAVATKVETHGLVGLLHIIASVTGADLKTAILAQFVAAAQLLTDLRNRYLHAELFGEADALLSPVFQVLSRVRPVCEQLAPTFWQRLVSDDDTLESYLRGIEEDIDGAWNVLLDYLRSRPPLPINWEFYATLIPNGGTLFIEAFRPTFANSFSFRAAIPISNVGGFFGEHLTPDSSRFFRSSDDAGAGLGVPPPSDFFGAIQSTLMREYRHTRGIGAQGLVPWSDGSIAMSDLDANGFFMLAGLKKSFLSANMRLEALTVVFKTGEEAGSVNGHVASGLTLSQAARPSKLRLDGSALLTAEYVYNKLVDVYPEGSTVRHVTVASKLQLADLDAAAA